MIRNCLHSLRPLIASFISSIDGYVSFNAMLLVESWLEKYVEGESRSGCRFKCVFLNSHNLRGCHCYRCRLFCLEDFKVCQIVYISIAGLPQIFKKMFSYISKQLTWNESEKQICKLIKSMLSSLKLTKISSKNHKMFWYHKLPYRKYLVKECLKNVSWKLLTLSVLIKQNYSRLIFVYIR